MAPRPVGEVRIETLSKERPFRGSIEASSSRAYVSAPLLFSSSSSLSFSLCLSLCFVRSVSLSRFVLVIIEESVRGRALWPASIVSEPPTATGAPLAVEVRAGSQEFTTHATTGCPSETYNGI